MAATLTTANAVITAQIEALYPQAQRMEGFAADDVYGFAEVENGEYSMGIDGKLSAGFVFNEVPFTMTFQADSPSLVIFENVWNYEQANRTKLEQQWTIVLPSLGRRYNLPTGFMRTYKAPDAKKILQPGVVQLIFSRVLPGPN
jgi:hypothetical protein